MATTKKEVLPEELDTIEPTVYEVSYLLDSALSEEDASSKHAEYKSFLENIGAEVIEEGAPESRKLAYLITVRRDSKRKDHTRAFFAWIKFGLAATEVSQFESMLKSDASVVRSLLIKTVRESTLRERMEGIDEDEESVEDEGDFQDKDLADNKKEGAAEGQVEEV